MPRRQRRKPTPPTATSHSSVPPWEDGGATSFGSWLTQQREVRKLTLREVSDATKIGMRYLEALEGDRFEVLPATIFAKGFLRNYAQYVGLDADEVINYYLVADAERRATEEGEEPPDETKGSTVHWAPTIAWVLAIVVVILVVVLIVNHRRAAAASAAGEETGAAAQSRLDRVGSDSRSAADPLGALQAGTTDQSGSTVASDISRAEPALSETEAVGVEEAVATAPLRVVLSFTGDCWVEARVDGRRQVSELRVQGESVHFQAEESVSLVLGDIASVQVEVNGESYGGLDQVEGRVEMTLRASEFIQAAEALADGPPAGFLPASSRAETGRPRVVAGARE